MREPRDAYAIAAEQRQRDSQRAAERAVTLETAARALEQMARGYDGYGCKVLNEGAARVRGLIQH